MSAFAATPAPPYYVVSFSSQRTIDDDAGYADMAEQMADLAARQPGYLGVESARDTSGFGITLSYWSDEASIVAWKRVVDHMAAQKLGRETWYAQYVTRVACVERAYAFDRPQD